MAKWAFATKRKNPCVTEAPYPDAPVREQRMHLSVAGTADADEEQLAQQTVSAPGVIKVSDISPEDMARRLTTIRPVIRIAHSLYFIEPMDPFNTSILWNPKFQEMALLMVPVAEITTYHTHGLDRKFEPNIVEVLAAIPAELVVKVVAFEIIMFPTEEQAKNAPELSIRGFHQAKVRLYRHG